MSKNKKVIITFILILIFVAGFGVFAQTLINESNKEPEKISLEYKENSNIDYKIYLKANKFYNVVYLSKGLRYVSVLTDHIDASFDYAMTFDEDIKGSYNYYIRGTLVVLEKESGNVIWQESYNLTEPVYKRFNSAKVIDIPTKVSIDYDSLFQKIMDFKDTYGVTVDATFNVELITNYQFEYSKFTKPIMHQKTVSINIPLSDVTYNIKNYNDSLNTKEQFIEENADKDINTNLRYIGYIIWIVNFIIIGVSIIFVYKLTTKKTKYASKLHKILKSYDSVIVNISKMPKLDEYNIINVTEFSELMDLQSELRIPISFIENEVDAESTFILIHQKEAWVYKLNIYDLDRKNDEIFKI